jgi:hypothetical protein
MASTTNAAEGVLALLFAMLTSDSSAIQSRNGVQRHAKDQ